LVGSSVLLSGEGFTSSFFASGGFYSSTGILQTGNGFFSSSCDGSVQTFISSLAYDFSTGFGFSTTGAGGGAQTGQSLHYFKSLTSANT